MVIVVPCHPNKITAGLLWGQPPPLGLPPSASFLLTLKAGQWVCTRTELQPPSRVNVCQLHRAGSGAEG